MKPDEEGSSLRSAKPKRVSPRKKPVSSPSDSLNESAPVTEALSKPRGRKPREAKEGKESSEKSVDTIVSTASFISEKRPNATSSDVKDVSKRRAAPHTSDIPDYPVPVRRTRRIKEDIDRDSGRDGIDSRLSAVRGMGRSALPEGGNDRHNEGSKRRGRPSVKRERIQEESSSLVGASSAPSVRVVSDVSSPQGDSSVRDNESGTPPVREITVIRETVVRRPFVQRDQNNNAYRQHQGISGGQGQSGQKFGKHKRKNKHQRPFNKKNNGEYNNNNREYNNRRPLNGSMDPDDVAIYDSAAWDDLPLEEVDGLLELTAKGFGFLRTEKDDFEQGNGAVYVSADLIRKYGLRPAQWLYGTARKTPRGIQMVDVKEVNKRPVEEAKTFPHFDELKAVNPNRRVVFETVPERYTTRVVDLMAPVGRGQRGLIVAPPRSGKTVLLEHLAEAVRENHPEMHLMILLVDERPEEVTEFKRTIKGAEIYASSNDGKVKDHCRMAELCIDRARRLVESGHHVFILMDSITRLARAYNNAHKGSGRTMSGGIDAAALEMPRRLFAAARNTRGAGSLTIIATALVETNSRMDDLIFQEFKGTGNMELVLNRRIAEQYVYPAVDILKSGTRREELILPELVFDKVCLIRRALAGHKPLDAMERLLFFLKKYETNTQMLIDLKQR